MTGNIGIRTVTFNLKEKMSQADFERIAVAKRSFSGFRYPVRTFRINGYPLTEMNDEYVNGINDFCSKEGLRWFSTPFRLPKSGSKQNGKHFTKDTLEDAVYEYLAKYPKGFANLAGSENGVMDFEVIDVYTRLMKRVSRLSPDGTDNFRYGLSVNAKQDGPFFPFTESSGQFSFSIGLELTEMINEIADTNCTSTLEELRDMIAAKLDSQITEIEEKALKVEEVTGIAFRGFDFSLAPTLRKNGSLLQLLKRFGVKDFGGGGSFFATATLTNILKSFGKKHRHVGFSGLMYSVLEDRGLCDFHNRVGVRLNDLIKLSTMCGCGIDMVPVHESESTDVLKSYIYDICAISCRLDNKPLGVRFLAFDDRLEFTDFEEDDFLTNGRILELGSNAIDDHDISEFSFWEVSKDA